MTIIERVGDLMTRAKQGLRSESAPTPVGIQPMDLSIVPEHYRVPFRNHTYTTLAKEGFKSNSAVYSCVKELAKRAKEPPIYAYDLSNKRAENHPLELLIRRPNQWMNDRRLVMLCTIYAAISGNAYLYKQRNRFREVVALYPYNDSQIQPVPTPDYWISHYRYDIGNGERPILIPVEDIVHLTWDNVDPEAPWKGFGPLLALAREVDTDTELTKMVYAFLRNDATPRTLVNLKPVTLEAADGGSSTKVTRKKISDKKGEKQKERFLERHGGDKRGGVMIVRDSEVEVHRLSMGLKEIEANLLYEHSETRIPIAFGIDPMVISFAAGMRHSTYSNKEEARLAMIEDTMVPFWQHWSDILTMQLAPDFDHVSPVSLRFDLSQVAALLGKTMRIESHATKLYVDGTLTRNEARERMRMPAVEGGDQFAPNRVASITLADDEENEKDEQKNDRPDDKKKSKPKKQKAKDKAKDRENDDRDETGDNDA